MPEMVIATANRGKAREFQEMLSGSGLRFVDLATLPPAPDVEETGATFRANACIKASACAKHFNRWALADDSGLEVDALQNSPGVFSARWARMHDAGTGDAANNALVLAQIEDVADADRTARFVCVLALSDPAGRIIFTTRGTVEGTLLRSPRGSNGFGYDPLFFIATRGKTTAELSPQDKHAISHRGQALRAMKDLLDRNPI